MANRRLLAICPPRLRRVGRGRCMGRGWTGSLSVAKIKDFCFDNLSSKMSEIVYNQQALEPQGVGR